MSEEKHALSENTFNSIFGLIASDAKFRERFAVDPEQAVRDAGILLTVEEAKALGSAGLRRRMIEMETFDERLVLMSSAGY